MGSYYLKDPAQSAEPFFVPSDDLDAARFSHGTDEVRLLCPRRACRTRRFSLFRAKSRLQREWCPPTQLAPSSRPDREHHRRSAPCGVFSAPPRLRMPMLSSVLPLLPACENPFTACHPLRFIDEHVFVTQDLIIIPWDQGSEHTDSCTGATHSLGGDSCARVACVASKLSCSMSAPTNFEVAQTHLEVSTAPTRGVE